MTSLRVVLHECKDLPVSDYSFMGGKSDPYVTFKVASSTQKSSCIKSNLNPVWNSPNGEEFLFQVRDIKSECLEIRVYDYDRFSRDDLLAVKVVPLAQFERQKQPEKVAYTLDLEPDYIKQNCKSEIHLELFLHREGTSDKTFELWENQRYHVIKKWTTETFLGSAGNERKRWSRVDDSTCTSDTFAEVAPKIPKVFDEEGWSLDVSQGDDEGWLYAISWAGPWQKESTLAMVRRRKWINKCKVKPEVLEEHRRQQSMRPGNHHGPSMSA